MALPYLRDLARFFVYVLYCVEGGLFLAIVPWSRLWPRNYYFERVPWLRDAGLHPVTRGVVSAIGVALLLHGAWHVLQALSGTRRRARSSPAGEVAP